jgi:hypothetical protein
MTVVTCTILRDLITPDDPRPTAYNSWNSLPLRLSMLHGSWWPFADWLAGYPSPPHLHALTTTVMAGKLLTLNRPICVFPLSNNFMWFFNVLIDCSQLTSQDCLRNRFAFDPFHAVVEIYTPRKQLFQPSKCYLTLSVEIKTCIVIFKLFLDFYDYVSVTYCGCCPEPRQYFVK